MLAHSRRCSHFFSSFQILASNFFRGTFGNTEPLRINTMQGMRKMQGIRKVFTTSVFCQGSSRDKSSLRASCMIPQMVSSGFTQCLMGIPRWT